MSAHDNAGPAPSSGAGGVLVVFTVILCALVIGGSVYFIVTQMDAKDQPIAGGPPQASAGPQIGEEAPVITGEDLDGKQFKLSDYRGKVVLLDFWGNW